MLMLHDDFWNIISSKIFVEVKNIITKMTNMRIIRY